MSIDVLHLLPSLSLYGGTPRKIRDLIQHSHRKHAIYCWAKWDKDDASIDFDEEFRKCGIPVFPGRHGQNLALHLKEISKIISKENIKVVHGYFETGLLLSAASKILNRHLATAVSFVGFPADGLSSMFCNQLSRYIDEVVYVSNYTRKTFETKYPQLKKRSGRIIYNGVKYRHPIAKISQQHSGINAIAVSGLVDWKNIQVLIHAIALISRKSHPIEITLSIIGDGPMREALENLAVTLNITNQIKFHGYQEDIGAHLVSSHIYLHPSLKEGFGIAVPEAMLAGLAVAVANAGALPELIENRQTGLIVNNPKSPSEWAEAILLLAQDEELRLKLGHAATASALSRFSMDRFSIEHESLYTSLISQKT